MRHSELIKLITKKTGVTPKQKDLALMIKKPVGTINSRASRDLKYSVDEVQQISMALGIDIYQEQFVEKKLTETEIKDCIQFISQDTDTVAGNYYPDIFGSCGTGTFVPAEYKERIHIPKQCIHGYSRGKIYSVINARGDSMQPYIQDKDLLIFEDYDGEQICDNRIYVFRYGDKIFVKRLILNINQLIIKSDNPAPEYKTITIDLTENTDIQIIGKFAGLMRKAE